MLINVTARFETYAEDDAILAYGKLTEDSYGKDFPDFEYANPSISEYTDMSMFDYVGSATS